MAKNEDFVALTQAILDAAVANKCRTLDEVKALPMGKGTIQEAVTDRSGYHWRENGVGWLLRS